MCRCGAPVRSSRRKFCFLGRAALEVRSVYHVPPSGHLRETSARREFIRRIARKHVMLTRLMFRE
jgi:hypothetical protein